MGSSRVALSQDKKLAEKEKQAARAARFGSTTEDEQALKKQKRAERFDLGKAAKAAPVFSEEERAKMAKVRLRCVRGRVPYV